MLYFPLFHEIEHYHFHKLWFSYCNPCNLLEPLSLKLGNELKKIVRDVAIIKYGVVELVVIFFSFDTKCIYVISSDLCYAGIAVVIKNDTLDLLSTILTKSEQSIIKNS